MTHVENSYAPMRAMFPHRKVGIDFDIIFHQIIGAYVFALLVGPAAAGTHVMRCHIQNGTECRRLSAQTRAQLRMF